MTHNIHDLALGIGDQHENIGVQTVLVDPLVHILADVDARAIHQHNVVS